jgi:hypothetical protein
MPCAFLTMIALQNGVCVVIRRHSLTRHEAKAILPHVANLTEWWRLAQKKASIIRSSIGRERSAQGGCVPSEPVARESRRSTRVRLKVRVAVQSVTEPLTCEGETIVVNLHGALVMTAVALRVGMKVSIRVQITDKAAAAEVVYIDPDQPRHCGIRLAKPENIWGVSLLPDDWREGDVA